MRRSKVTALLDAIFWTLCGIGIIVAGFSLVMAWHYARLVLP